MRDCDNNRQNLCRVSGPFLFLDLASKNTSRQQKGFFFFFVCFPNIKVNDLRQFRFFLLDLQNVRGY